MALLMAAAPGVGAQPALAPGDAAHRAIYRELVEIDSSPAGGREPQAAAAVGERLRRAGFPAAAVVVDGAVPECQNVVATLAGRNRETPPLLMLAHLDVVNARREDWTHDPFVLREADGYFFGRGTLDNKAGASVLVANMVQWQRDAFVPAREIEPPTTTPGICCSRSPTARSAAPRWWVRCCRSPAGRTGAAAR